MAADSTQTASPTSVGEINNAVPFTGGTVRWTNFANAIVVNGSFAIAALTSGFESYGLIFKGFSFDLPDSAVIREIRLKLTGFIDESNHFIGGFVSVTYPTFTTDINKLALLTTSSSTITFTWDRDDLVGFTPALANSANLLGVAVRMTNPAATRTVNIDGVSLEIDFESAPRPEYANVILLDKVAIISANTSRDGTGTLGILDNIVNTSAGGTILNRLEFTATAATTAGMIRVFLARGTSSATSDLFAEIPVSAITPSATVAAWSGILEFPGGLLFPTDDAGLSTKIDIRVGTHNAEAFNVFAFGSQYE